MHLTFSKSQQERLKWNGNKGEAEAEDEHDEDYALLPGSLDVFFHLRYAHVGRDHCYDGED